MNKNKVRIGIIFLVIDQITKLLTQLFDVNIPIIKNFFHLEYYQNTGAAWSILEGHSKLLIIITLIMIVLVFSLTYSYKSNKLIDLAFGLLFGGILGNLIDRIFYGYVRDFIVIKIFNYTFPVFNIADMIIVAGVIILLYETIKGDIKDDNKGRRRKQIEN